MSSALQAIAFGLGGEGGCRLASQLQMPAIADTLLRLICNWSVTKLPVATIIGVDNWAMRKRVSYGTIVVDITFKSSIINPYLGFLESRFGEGCRNGMQLWREISAKSYPGTWRQALRWMGKRRRQDQSAAEGKGTEAGNANTSAQLRPSPGAGKMPSPRSIGLANDAPTFAARRATFLRGNSTCGGNSQKQLNSPDKTLATGKHCVLLIFNIYVL
jgi:hypothetical protein